MWDFPLPSSFLLLSIRVAFHALGQPGAVPCPAGSLVCFHPEVLFLWAPCQGPHAPLGKDNMVSCCPPGWLGGLLGPESSQCSRSIVCSVDRVSSAFKNEAGVWYLRPALERRWGSSRLHPGCLFLDSSTEPSKPGSLWPLSVLDIQGLTVRFFLFFFFPSALLDVTH